MAFSYQLGTPLAAFYRVNPVDLITTYLAIGSAFAMRAYFLNRRRSSIQVFLAVFVELLLWLPLFVIRLGRRLTQSVTANSSAEETGDSDLTALIEDALRSLPHGTFRKKLQAALERYAALRSAVVDPSFRPEGEFELFAIAGHLNTRTGTAALARKNASKVLDHKRRTVDDLLTILDCEKSSDSGRLRSDLMEFFEIAGDGLSAAKLQRRVAEPVSESRRASADAAAARVTS